MSEPLGTDSTLSHYRILSRIGAGGMGEVYLAQDTKLDRKVALKILPADLASNKDRMDRFIREAKSAAALSHPHIAQVFEIGEHDGMHFIAMEFVDGATLRETMQDGRTDFKKLLRILQQVAEGLSKAHAAGIVHRDLKPDNIMISRDGFAKVLDFGLAKLVELSGLGPGGSSDSNAPTELLKQHSAPGVVMGTAGYMSPEQAQGRTADIDQRSDIFSFGCILFEAVTGQRAFAGKDAIDTLNKIIREPAPLISDFRVGVPDHLQRIVRRCLAKDREDRYQTIKDVAIELRDLRREMELAGVDTAGPSTRPEGAVSSGGAIKPPESGGAETASAGSVTAPVSSAEYIVSEIKRHKLAAAILAVLVIGAAIGAGFYYHARSTEVAIESIAVLPFENRSNDPDTDYISDGITESINNSLTRLPNLKVIPRSVASHYKGKGMDAQKAGEELRVNAVLTGRVAQRGDNLTISVELDDVRYGKQLWGEQYNRKVADLLAVNGDIAREVSQRLRSQLSGEDQRRLTRGSTEHPEAYQLYLKGNYYTSKLTKEGFRRGIDYFNQAVAIDPNYALAYSGLAFNYINSEDWFIPPKEAAPKAKAAAEKALAIDDSLADAHLSLAIIAHWYSWDWPAAEREFIRAIDLAPDDPRPRGFYSWFLAAVGRKDQAVAEARKGQQLDPVSPEANLFLGSILVFVRQYEQAVEPLRNTVEVEPAYWYAHEFLGRAYEQTGRREEALKEFQRAFELEQENAENWASLGYAYATSGRSAEAQKMIEELKRRSAQTYVAPYNVAVIYAGLGDKDQAFAWLERALAERSSFMAFSLTTDAHLDTLRSDPRFEELIRRVGLPL